MKILLPTTESLPAGAPVIGFAGGGFRLSWILGVAHGMKKYGVPYERCVLSGASAGAVVAALLLSGADTAEVRDWIGECPLMLECFASSTGAALKARALMTSILQRFIPADMTMYNGKLYILLCDQHKGLYFINTYRTRDELIEALLATTHVPYFSDGSYAYMFRGQPHVDGAWNCSREGVLMCRPSTFKVLIDHSDDGWMHGDDKKGFYMVADRKTHASRFAMGVTYARLLLAQGKFPRMHPTGSGSVVFPSAWAGRDESAAQSVQASDGLEEDSDSDES